MTEKYEMLCAKRDKLLDKGKALDAEKDYEMLDSINKEIEALDKAIDAQETFERSEKASLSTKPTTTTDTEKFDNFADQMRAIMVAGVSKGKNVDKRLVKDEIKGVNTETGADGGYAIQSDFIGNILDSAFEKSSIVSRCRRYTVTKNSNRVNYVTLDDSEDATASGIVVAGGVQAYWADEGGTVTKSKPKIKVAEIKLAKIMGISYATEESLEDIPFASQLIESSFSDAVAGLLTDAVLNGEGPDATTRQPLGVLASNALVTVTPADSTKLSYKDFLAMKSHMSKKNWANAAWFVHPDLEEILPTLKDDKGDQIFMPAGGISGAQYDTILGRPVIYDEFMAAKGSKGDILLADFNEYMLISKGTERKEWSMHVEFLTDQQCFRIVMRVNGAPIRNNTYAVRNSTNRRGAFVTLGARTAAAGGSSD